MMGFFLFLISGPALALLLLLVWPGHTLTQGGKPYLTRWPLLGGDGVKRAPWLLGRSRRNIFIHWIRASDGSALHNHPYKWCWSYLLWGSYEETRTYLYWKGTDLSRIFQAGDRIWIGPCAYHTLRLVTPSVWSIFVTGPKHGQGWGFLVKGEFIPANSPRGRRMRDEHVAK